jgi:hypothetical protein
MSNGYAGTDIWEISGDLHAGTSYALMDSLYFSKHPTSAVQSGRKNSRPITAASLRSLEGLFGNLRVFEANGRMLPGHESSMALSSSLHAGKVLLVETRSLDGSVALSRIVR